MQRTGVLLYLAVTFAIACPCNPERPDPPIDDPKGEQCIEEVQQSTCDAMCPATNLLADGRLCSDPPAGWAATPIATISSRCRLTWQGQNKQGDAGVPEPPPGTQRECEVLASGTVEEDLGALRTAWSRALSFDAMAELRADVGERRGPVRVAVIDDASPTSTSGHGVAMSAIIEEIACASLPMSECSVVMYSALGRRRAGSADADHGEYGLQSDVAEAIGQAVVDWEALPKAALPTRLVINLSIGWEPACDRGAGDVVREAIQRASTRGALVVAASGNRPPATCVKGPTAPATWASDPVGPDRNVPLLYAATAVDDEGGFLPTFRPLSAAPLEALGFMAVSTGTSRDPSRRYGPLSGSSVAAAVVSGSAAMLWHYEHERGAADIITRLRATATPRVDATGTNRPADFGMSPLAPQVEVSPCVTLGTVAGLSVDDARTRCKPAARMGDMMATLFTDADGDASTVSTEVGVASSCCLGATQPGGALAAWVGPQPGIPPCPLCGLKGSRATVRLDPAFSTHLLVTTQLTLWNAAGASQQFALEKAFTTDVTFVDNEAFRRTAGAPTVRGYITMHFKTSSGTAVTAGNVIPVTP